MHSHRVSYSQPSSQRQLTYSKRLAFTKATKCGLEFEAKIMATSLDLDLLQRLTHRPPQSLGNCFEIRSKNRKFRQVLVQNTFIITRDQNFLKVSILQSLW